MNRLKLLPLSSFILAVTSCGEVQQVTDTHQASQPLNIHKNMCYERGKRISETLNKAHKFCNSFGFIQTVGVVAGIQTVFKVYSKGVSNPKLAAIIGAAYGSCSIARLANAGVDWAQNSCNERRVKRDAAKIDVNLCRGMNAIPKDQRGPLPRWCPDHSTGKRLYAVKGQSATCYKFRTRGAIQERASAGKVKGSFIGNRLTSFIFKGKSNIYAKTRTQRGICYVLQSDILMASGGNQCLSQNSPTPYRYRITSEGNIQVMGHKSKVVADLKSTFKGGHAAQLNGKKVKLYFDAKIPNENGRRIYLYKEGRSLFLAHDNVHKRIPMSCDAGAPVHD